jgi:hypothetical protein
LMQPASAAPASSQFEESWELLHAGFSITCLAR